MLEKILIKKRDILWWGIKVYALLFSTWWLISLIIYVITGVLLGEAIDIVNWVYSLKGFFSIMVIATIRYIIEVNSEVYKAIRQLKAVEKKNEERLESERKQREFEEKQKAKGLVQFGNKWGTSEQVKKWKEIKWGIDQNFKNMTPFQFEEFVAKLLQKMGYKTEVTRKTGDYGIDIIARKKGGIVAVQCKKNSVGNNVGNIEVQKTLGAMWKIRADRALLITTSAFTIQAEEQAKGAPIELWDGRYLKRLVKKYFIDS